MWKEQLPYAIGTFKLPLIDEQKNPTDQFCTDNSCRNEMNCLVRSRWYIQIAKSRQLSLSDIFKAYELLEADKL